MSDQNDLQNEASAAEAPVKKGLLGQPKKKMTMQEQLREIGKLLIILVIGGLGYGAYVGYTYLRVQGFTLSDQFHKETTVDFSGEKPHVVLVSSLGSLEQAMPWGLKLLGSYGAKVENVRVADLSGSEPGIHGVIQGQLAKRVPIPVLLDFDGAVAKAFHAKEDSVTICVVGAGGAVKARASGEMNDENWAKISSAIDPLVQ